MRAVCLWLTVCCVVMIGGCAGLPTEIETFSTEEYLPEPERSGIYHKVEKGQTLWRIASAYNVSLVDVIRVNNIPDAAQIERNQLVFIPGAKQVKDIRPAEAFEDDNEFDWPVKGDVISYFHTQKGSWINKGIDIKVPLGTTVKASRSGRVVFADELSGYGKTVIVEHAGDFHTVYAHNAELLVDFKDRVAKYDPIARVGHGPKFSLLHFQIRKNSIENNPLHYLP